MKKQGMVTDHCTVVRGQGKGMNAFESLVRSQEKVRRRSGKDYGEAEERLRTGLEKVSYGASKGLGEPKERLGRGGGRVGERPKKG